MHESNYCKALLLALVAGALAAAPVAAMPPDDRSVDEEILDILRSEGKIDDAKYEQLKAKVQAEKEDGWDIYWKNTLNIKRKDGMYKLKLGGRIQADFAYINPTADLNAAVPGGQGTGVEFRRARLYMSGELWKRLIFKAQYDFAGGDPAFADVFVGLKKLGPIGTVRVGHMKEPFSLEELTSSKYITFMERALPAVFDSARNLGISAQNNHLDQRLTWALGVFAPTDSKGDYFEDDGAWNLTGRITGLPWYAEDGRKLVHLGFSASRGFRNDNAVASTQRPEAHLAKTYLATPAVVTDGGGLLNAELAWVHGPLSLQGEWKSGWVERPAASTVWYHGAYAQASYFLTGEHRAYNTKNGTFARVDVLRPFHPGKGQWGAVEVGVRYSFLDLKDQDINGGKEQNVTVGVNWHLWSNFRMMVNYVYADVKDTGDVVRDPDIPTPTNANGPISLIQARAAIEF